MKTIAVVGAGAAGWAAAWRALERGARVHVLSRGVGALDFSSGLLDAGARSAELSPDAEKFLRDEWEFEVAPLGASLLVATSAGLLREVSGASRAALDLGRCAPGRVGVLGLATAEFEERVLARALSLEPAARHRGLEFEPLFAEKFTFGGDASLRGFAMRLDEDATFRAQVLEKIDARARGIGVTTVLLSGCGGITTRLEATASGVRLGEVASNLEGAAGARFGALRRRFLARAGVLFDEERVERWERAGGRVVVIGGGARREVEGLVVATGGWISGGIEWSSTGPRRALRGPLESEPSQFEGSSESGWDATRSAADSFAVRQRSPIHLESSGQVAWAGEVLFPSSLGRVVEAGLRAADAVSSFARQVTEE